MLPLLSPAPAASSPAAPGVTPFNSADPWGSQLQTLFAIRAAIDANGWLAGDWTAERGAGGAYCNTFEGVQCDADKFVTGIKLHDSGDPLGGTLPSAQLLQQLPRLKGIWLANTFLTGSLPEDWGSLTQMEEIRLGRNQLFGRIPREWSGMTNLRELLLL